MFFWSWLTWLRRWETGVTSISCFRYSIRHFLPRWIWINSSSSIDFFGGFLSQCLCCLFSFSFFSSSVLSQFSSLIFSISSGVLKYAIIKSYLLFGLRLELVLHLTFVWRGNRRSVRVDIKNVLCINAIKHKSWDTWNIDVGCMGVKCFRHLGVFQCAHWEKGVFFSFHI